MCGIFGFVSQEPQNPELILNGLKILEYRGYDSWGIAIKNQNSNNKKQSTVLFEKHTGKIGLSATNLPPGTIGIGHTRWATHGGVTVKNSHPHTDCKRSVSIVHNGIVENFDVLKKDLLEKKHVFTSETDSEVIAHLIEEHLIKHDIKNAVRLAFNALKGLSAIVVLDPATNSLVVAKNGSPLILGVGNNKFFAASDLSAILPHTKQVVFLKDNEMAVLNTDLTVYGLGNGVEIIPKIEEITWKIQNESMGKHKHFMIKEISDQPKVIGNILYEYEDEVIKLASAIKKAQGTFFIAAGTAYNAALGGIYLFSKISHIHVNSAIASEFNYLEDFLNSKSLIIALSQSGETIDVIEPLSRAQKKGSKIAALTNTLGSSIYRMADLKTLLGAGPERSVASTKAYTAKLTFLLLAAYALNDKLPDIKPQIEKSIKEIKRMLTPEYISTIKKLAQKLKNSKTMYVIGRGVSYSSALEAALKIKEVSYIPTEGLAGGELKHGTIALIEKGTPCIVFAPNDETHDAILSNAIEIRSRGGFIIGVGPHNSKAFDYFLEVQDLGDASILAQIVPLQLLAYYLALARGTEDPDKPRNLAKSVTVK